MAESNVLRMSYDAKQKLRPVTLTEFDAARAFLQTQMHMLMAVMPQAADEPRTTYIDRVRNTLLGPGTELPEVVANLRRDGRDYVLALLANPDASERGIAVLRRQLSECERGVITASQGYSRLSRAINADNHAAMERAIYAEHAKHAKERKLNIQ